MGGGAAQRASARALSAWFMASKPAQVEVSRLRAMGGAGGINSARA